ncbi:MAG: hypothetical protein QW666_01320 [Candidatus Woesearchaeota archaeon]
MNDKCLIAKLDKEIKEIRENLRPVIKAIGEFEAKKYYLENIRPLSAIGESFKYKGISIRPGIIVDTRVDFDYIDKNKNKKYSRDFYLDGQIEFSICYEPKYDLYDFFYNRKDTGARELVLKRNFKKNMILDILFQHKWIHFTRTIKKYLDMNAIPAEIERFKQDAELAKMYADEMIAGKKPCAKRNPLSNRVEKEMSKMEAKGIEVCKLKEKEYCKAMDGLREEGYLAHGGLYFPILVTPPIKYKDRIINLCWDEGEKSIRLAYEFKPKGYKPPKEPFCRQCAGEDDYQEPFGIGMHLGKKNIELHRIIPYNPALLPKELERFRRDLKLVMHYGGFYGTYFSQL